MLFVNILCILELAKIYIDCSIYTCASVDMVMRIGVRMYGINCGGADIYLPVSHNIPALFCVCSSLVAAYATFLCPW